MGVLTWTVSRLPISWVKAVSRSQFMGPRQKKVFNRLADLFRSGDQTIANGVGKGLRFNAGGTCAGYVLGTNDPEVQKALAGLVKPGDVFYDVGANVGFLSVLAGRLIGPSGRIVAFEPFPNNVKCLTHNLEINEFKNSEVHAVAVGERDGTAGFMVTEESGLGKLAGYERDHDVIQDKIDVPIRTLDGLHEEKKFPPPTVIKIDVEGAEVEVLNGARHTIADAKPLLFIEIHDTNKRVAETLDDMNYVYRSLGPIPLLLEAAPLSMLLAAHNDDPKGRALIEDICRHSREIR